MIFFCGWSGIASTPLNPRDAPVCCFVYVPDAILKRLGKVHAQDGSDAASRLGNTIFSCRRSFAGVPQRRKYRIDMSLLNDGVARFREIANRTHDVVKQPGGVVAYGTSEIDLDASESLRARHGLEDARQFVTDHLGDRRWTRGRAEIHCQETAERHAGHDVQAEGRGLGLFELHGDCERNGARSLKGCTRRPPKRAMDPRDLPPLRSGLGMPGTVEARPHAVDQILQRMVATASVMTWRSGAMASRIAIHDSRDEVTRDDLNAGLKYNAMFLFKNVDETVLGAEIDSAQREIFASESEYETDDGSDESGSEASFSEERRLAIETKNVVDGVCVCATCVDARLAVSTWDDWDPEDELEMHLRNCVNNAIQRATRQLDGMEE